MEQHDHRNHAPVPQDGGVPATFEEAYDPPSCRAELDANGFDPNEFEWRPVPRRPRADGWTPEVQQRFINALAEHGTVEAACRDVGMAVGSAYRLRQAPGAEGFAAAWRATLSACADRVLDLCFERVIAGVDEPVFDRDGVRIGAKLKFDHRMAVTILRAYFPERFRHGDARAGHASPPPAALPVATAVARLAPVTPAEPHTLMPQAVMTELIDGARGRAEAEALHPRDEREPYRAPRVEESHPVAVERGRKRRHREFERDLRTMSDEERAIATGDVPRTGYCGNPDDPWYAAMKAENARAAGESDEYDLDDDDLLDEEDEDLLDDEPSETSESGDGGSEREESETASPSPLLPDRPADRQDPMPQPAPSLMSRNPACSAPSAGPPIRTKRRSQ